MARAPKTPAKKKRATSKASPAKSPRTPKKSSTASRQKKTPSNAPAEIDRKAAAARFGEIVMLMMTAQRYWHMSIHELEWLVLQPLMRNQIAVATGSAKMEGEEQSGTVGAAIWARVSPEVDTKIKQQIEQKVFPVRLKPEDWTSGDIVWLLDIIAPTKLLATKLFSELGKAGLGKGKIQAHPIVGATVDVEFLRKSGAKIDEAAS